jgi:transcriptional regulator with XRE-family HTH domain
MYADLTFGNWLQRKRKALDLTQAELAQRVGYARVTIHKIETDELHPSRQMAERLADELTIALAERPAFAASSRRLNSRLTTATGRTSSLTSGRTR